MGALISITLSLLAIFLILLVLVQRGRGGGLAGALGGMGGSSAFGAKAGDVFTRITIVVAAIWILLSLIAVYWAGHRGDALGTAAPAPAGGPQDPAPPRSTGQDKTGPPVAAPTTQEATPPATPPAEK